MAINRKGSCTAELFFTICTIVRLLKKLERASAFSVSAGHFAVIYPVCREANFYHTRPLRTSQKTFCAENFRSFATVMTVQTILHSTRRHTQNQVHNLLPFTRQGTIHQSKTLIVRYIMTQHSVCGTCTLNVRILVQLRVNT